MPIELIIEPRARAISPGVFVDRLLPISARRSVGPFVFFDHYGPAEVPIGGGGDVLPHPHIGLSTVTYLLEGESDHRDSVGSFQTIRPGDINWMTAGRGIAHSESTPDRVKANGGRAHLVQLWVSLPVAHEEEEPSFVHHPAATLPMIERPDGGVVRVLAGEAYGARSPVVTRSPLFYVDATLPAGATLELPAAYAERAVYVVSGRVSSDGRAVEPGQLAVFSAGEAALQAESGARLLSIGGDPHPEPRYIWWNFVSSSQARIERAAEDWRSGRFAVVSGDDRPRVPAPDGPRFARREA